MAVVPPDLAIIPSPLPEWCAIQGDAFSGPEALSLDILWVERYSPVDILLEKDATRENRPAAGHAGHAHPQGSGS